jgi:riboflavin kinase/FMN adenylyltransferase
VQRFDADFASQSAEDFVRIVLRDQLSAKAVVVGHDFRFGAQRRGDCDLLVALSRTYDFSVSQVDPVMLSGEVISSSRIRTLLAEGNVNRAAQCLTRPYDIDATVIEGQKRGRKIGFPTANLLLIDNVQLPQYGVYAAYFTVLNQGPQNAAWVVRHPAVVNIGLRPTFEAGFSIEAHLLDFNGSLVGASIRLAFIERIRSEQKFSSIDELTAQIRLDIAAAGRFF